MSEWTMSSLLSRDRSEIELNLLVGINETIALPAARQRTGLGLAIAIAHDGGDNEVGIIHHRAKGVNEDVAQLAALVDGPWRWRADVTGNAARSRELAEELQQPFFVLCNLWKMLGVTALQIHICHQRRTAVPGPAM